MGRRAKLPALVLCGVLALWLWGNWGVPALWRADPGSRHWIVNSLTRHHQLVGMTEGELTGLLGPADADAGHFKLDSRTYAPGEVLIYRVGTVYVDQTWLVLPMEDGVCTEAFIDVT